MWYCIESNQQIPGMVKKIANISVALLENRMQYIMKGLHLNGLLLRE